MKKATFLLLLFASLLSNAQITVIKKPIIIVQLKGAEWKTQLELDSAQGLGFYSFLFRSNKYSELVDMKILAFTDLQQLHEFGEAFKTAEKSDPGDRVAVKDYFIVKSKTMGFTGYTLYYDNAYCELSSKMMQKLTQAIDQYYQANALSTELLPTKPANN